MKNSRLSAQTLGTRANDLFQQACPSKQDEAFFNRQMQRALSLGMTWLEGLQFVIVERRALN
ncbi:MAG: hypothetical protein ACRYFU_25675 [Janthinobacterium lividum]